MGSFPIFIYFTPKREDCRAQHESFSNVLFLCISPRCMDAFLQYSKWASQSYISCCVNLKIWKLLEKCCEAPRTIKTDDICLYYLRRYLLFLIYCISVYVRFYKLTCYSCPDYCSNKLQVALIMSSFIYKCTKIDTMF